MKNNLHRKYPRTPHLAWSPGASEDDIRIIDTHHFDGKQIVITEKMDGENTTMYSDYMHARSINSKHHPSRSQVKRLHAEIQTHIPHGWRLCGENLYARHSIPYADLKGYFYLFSVWNDRNICLSWEETLIWAKMLDLPTPKVLFEGPWNETFVRELDFDTDRIEGYVIRLYDAFAFDAFHTSVAKWVRCDHVQTDEHWMNQTIIPNLIS